jgi:hydroxypyruvate isomerase
MPRFAANLSMLYTEHAFLERFEAAAADGFKAVEFLFPYEYPSAVLAEQLRRHGLNQALFNAPSGDWATGERGLACLPGREAEFRAGLEMALAYAAALHCPRIHVMAGIGPADEHPSAVHTTYLDNLAWAAERARSQAVDICIEPINQRDMPGYFLSSQAQALHVIAAIAAPNLRLQFDAYHCQVSEGDVTNRLRRAIALGVLGHVQLAGAPDRHEPDQGELRVDDLLGLLDESGYSGLVGCEYRPRAGTREGLGWLKPWLKP